MRDIVKSIGMFLFYILAVIVILWTASNNLDVLYKATHDDKMAWFGLSLFEGGTIVWLIYFIYGARGITQRAVAFIASFIDLVLVIVSVAIHLLANVNPSEWRDWTIGIIVTATLVNGFLMWVSHLADPQSIEAIRRQSYQDKTMELAYKKAETKRTETADKIADAIASSMVEEAHGELHARYVKPSVSASQPVSKESTNIPKAEEQHEPTQGFFERGIARGQGWLMGQGNGNGQVK